MLPGILSITGFSGAEGFSAEFLASYADSYADPLTFAATDLGEANDTRRIFVTIGFSGVGGAELTINSVTIGGVSATIHTQDTNRHSGNSSLWANAIVSAVVPTGTTGDIVIDWSGASNGTVTIGVFRAVGLVGGIIDADSGHNVGAGSGHSISVNVPAEGVIISMAGGKCAGSATTVTLTSPSPLSYDNALSDGSILRDQAADPTTNVQGSISGTDCNIGVASVTWTGQ